MWKRKGVVVQCCLILLTTFWMSSSIVHAEGEGSGLIVKKAERQPVVSNENGEITAARISDGFNGSYLLHFFALEPKSLLLPLVLNADMIFYVQQGSGRVSWTEANELKHMYVRRGDVYRLVQGSVFYIISDAEQQRLNIHAIFTNSNDDLREPATQPYSSVQDTVLSFDKTILQATFKVREEVIAELLGGTKPPAIIRVDNLSLRYLEQAKGKGRKRADLFNLLEAQKKIANRYGWSTVVTKKQLPALEDSLIGLFMINLTAGSMMEPHWNTIDAEVVVGLEGRGMVRVLSPSISKGTTRRFEVEQGDVLVVPRFHPTVQMAFNNGSFVLMGFTRMMKNNGAQLIAGKSSVLHALSRDVLELSFNLRRTTLDELLLASREDSVISSCLSCAEEELQIMKGEGKPLEGETGSYHGGDEGKTGEEAGRPHGEEEAEGHRGGGQEEAGRQHGEDEQPEREEAEGYRGGGEEEAASQQGADEHREDAEWPYEGGEGEAGRQHGGGDEQFEREGEEGHRGGDEWPHGGGEEEAGRQHEGRNEQREIEEAGWGEREIEEEGDEQRERGETEGQRGGDEWQHGGEEEEAERQHGGDDEQLEREMAEGHHEGEEEAEAQRRNHYYVQGVRRILKRK